MKISCLPVSFYGEVDRGKMSIGDWFRMAKFTEYLDGADLGIGMIRKRTPAYLEALKAELHKIGIPLIMLAMYPDYTHPDPVQRKREVDFAISDIALASELGAKYVRLTAGSVHAGMSREDGIRWATEGLLATQEATAHYGVKLLFENHPGCGAWGRDDIGRDMDVFLNIYQNIKGSGIGLNFDIYHLTASGSDYREILPQLREDICTIHVNDAKISGGTENRTASAVAIGTGDSPIPEIFSYLKESGFDGWLCIEEYTNRGVKGVTEAAAYVRKTWDRA